MTLHWLQHSSSDTPSEGDEVFEHGGQRANMKKNDVCVQSKKSNEFESNMNLRATWAAFLKFRPCQHGGKG